MSDVVPPTTIGIQSADELTAARLALLEASRYRLSIHLPALPPGSFSSSAELDQLRRIATSGRAAEIRILLLDPAATLRTGHRLVDLAQRLPSVFLIRAPLDEQDLAVTSTWMFNDTGGYLLQPDASRPIGRTALNDRRGLAPLLLQFEQTWQRAAPASLLQPLDL